MDIILNKMSFLKLHETFIAAPGMDLPESPCGRVPEKGSISTMTSQPFPEQPGAGHIFLAGVVFDPMENSVLCSHDEGWGCGRSQEGRRPIATALARH